MADNGTFQSATPATLPASFVVSTDEVTIGGVTAQVQRVKLVDGADGGNELIGGTASNGLEVDVTRVQGDVAVGGDTAHDAADAGDPVKIGGYASASAPTSVSDGDRVAAWFGVDGRLKVDPIPPSAAAASSYVNVRLTDGGTFYNASGGGAAVTDKSNFTEGTSGFLPVGGVYNETAAGDPAEDQVAVARITAKRAVHVNIRNATGVEMGTVGAPFYVVPSAWPYDVAHDAVDTGNPAKVGGKAATALPTAVANGDRVNALFDELGRLIVQDLAPGSPTLVTATLTSTSDTQVISAPGASTSIYVCSVLVSNSSATLTKVLLKDGNGGTARVNGVAAANGGQFSYTPRRPWKLTANTGLYAALSAAVTDVVVTIEYFTAP